MGHLPSGFKEHEECPRKVQREAKAQVMVFAEIFSVVVIVLLLLFCFRQRTELQHQVPTEIPTQSPTPTMTPSPTVTPTNTPSPSPTPSPIPEGKAVEKGHTFKPYTGHWAYNLKGSAQHSLQNVCHTAENGIRVVVDPYGVERYCVALGTYWAGGQPKDIGRCLDVYMINGAVLHCVLADVKRQEDTKGDKNRYGKINNDLLEFIVDEKHLPSSVKECGNVSKAGTDFEGDAWQIVVLDYWIEGFGR